MKYMLLILSLIILIACSEDYQNGMSATSYIEKVDTLYVSNTDTVFVSEYDTILVSKTDTIRVSKLDTVLLTKTDTVSKTVKDTLIIREIFNHIDTVKNVDTVKVIFTDTLRATDTIKVTFKDTITVRDTVKVSDTAYVSVSSSSSEKLASSSSSSITVYSSSSSIEEVKKSVKDSITTFFVDEEEYTLVSRTVYWEEVDPPVFVHSAYNDYGRLCEEVGGTSVTSVNEVRKLAEVVFDMISSEENTFIGVRHDKPDYVLCTADSSLCEFKGGKEYYSSSLNFAVNNIYYVAYHKKGLDAGAIMVACKY